MNKPTSSQELLGYLQICGLNSHELKTAKSLLNLEVKRAVVAELRMWDEAFKLGATHRSSLSQRISELESTKGRAE